MAPPAATLKPLSSSAAHSTAAAAAGCTHRLLRRLSMLWRRWS